MNLNFLLENRTIGSKRVNESYTRLKTIGFIKEVGMIEYVTGNCLEGKKILSASIEKKDNNKELSLKNWKLVMKEVPYNPDIKVCIDGQGRLIALMLMKLIDSDNTIDDENIYKGVTVPEEMDVTEFTLLRNSGIPWNIGDVQNTNISSGNDFIDRISTIGKEEGLLQQVVNDLYSLNTGSLKASIIKGLKTKTLILPKSIKLDETSISDGNEVLNALKNSDFLAKELYNNTRFSKGLKQFVKESKIATSVLCKLISKIDKTMWEKYFTAEAGTSAEAQLYKSGFTQLNKLIFE